MKLKVREASEVTLPLTVAEGFEVEVRYLSRKQTEALLERCSRRQWNRQTGQAESVIDADKWSAHAPDTYIAGWRGLTPKIIRQLGIELDEEPPTDADGFVVYDQELARDLWRYSFADKFSQQILDFSKDILAAKDEAERLRKNVYAA